MAALEAEECAMPHESITDGGTMPKNAQQRDIHKPFSTQTAFAASLRFCFFAQP